MSKSFYVIKKKLKRGYSYYVRWAGEKTAHATGCRTRRDAEEWARERLGAVQTNVTVREYLEPYFTPECPHVQRLRGEGKSIGDTYIDDQRGRIKLHIFPDLLSNIHVSDLRRADVLDFRQRLIKKGVGPRTINRVIGILKIAFREGVYREELERNPADGIGNITYEEKEPGVFSTEELSRIFESNPGIWRDSVEYTCFLLAAASGLRRGELLALTWGQIDFDRSRIRIDRAMKSRDGSEIGKPKWGRTRETYLVPQSEEALRELRNQSDHVLPDGLVFGYPDGTIRLEKWWGGAFKKAMINAGIDAKARNLTPHSFRHSCATLLAEAQQDPRRIREALGWTGEIVADRYIHAEALSLDGLRSEAESFLSAGN